MTTQSNRRSVSGLAQQALGGVQDFRKILEMNPGQIPFEFPPQVEQGLSAAREVADNLGLDLKVPSSADLKNLATGKLDLILKGVRGKAEEALGTAEESTGQAVELLQRIDWLL